MRLTVAALIVMFAAVAISSEVGANDRFVEEVKASNVQFIYSDDGKLTFIKTEDTAEAVDALVAKKPRGIVVKVVNYINNGRAGWELKEDE